MPLEAAELPGSACTSAAATPLQFQDLHAPVTSVQPSSPVTAQYPTALSEEARKINSFSFLALTACQRLSLRAEHLRTKCPQHAGLSSADCRVAPQVRVGNTSSCFPGPSQQQPKITGQGGA